MQNIIIVAKNFDKNLIAFKQLHPEVFEISALIPRLVTAVFMMYLHIAQYDFILRPMIPITQFDLNLRPTI